MELSSLETSGDTLGSILTCIVPLSQLKAVSLYVMGSLGLSVLIDVVETTLQDELIPELLLSGSLDSLEGSLVGAQSVDVEWRLAAPWTSGVWGVGGAGWVPDDNLSYTGTLGDGLELLMVDRWWSNGSTVGVALAGWGNWGMWMQLGRHLACLGRSFLGWLTKCRRCFDLGMQLGLCLGLWFSVCHWCCLALIGMLKWMGLICSLVLWYLLTLACMV